MSDKVQLRLNESGATTNELDRAPNANSSETSAGAYHASVAAMKHTLATCDLVGYLRAAARHFERYGLGKKTHFLKWAAGLCEDMWLDHQRLEAITGTRVLGDAIAPFSGPTFDRTVQTDPDWPTRARTALEAGDIPGARKIAFSNHDWTSSDLALNALCREVAARSTPRLIMILTHCDRAPYLNGDRTSEAALRYVRSLYMSALTDVIAAMPTEDFSTPQLRLYRQWAEADLGREVKALPVDDETQTPWEEITALRNAALARFSAVPPLPQKLRVAVCISGQWRGTPEAFVNVPKQLAGQAEVDVFAALWRETGVLPTTSKHLLRTFDQRTAKFLVSLDKPFPEVLIETLPWLAADAAPLEKAAIEALAPGAVIQLESYEAFRRGLSGKVGASQAATRETGFAMFRMISLAAKMQEAAGSEYDLIIRTRPDLLLPHLNLEEIASRLRNPGDLGIVGLVEDGVADVFAIGRPEAMTRYASIWDRIVDAGAPHYLPAISGGLGEKLVFRHMVAEGCSPVVLRGALAPSLQSRRFSDAEIANGLETLAAVRPLTNEQASLRDALAV